MLHSTSHSQSESASGSRLSGDDLQDEALKSLDAHRPLVAASVRWAKSVGLLRHEHQVEDARQAGQLGFLEARRRFDPSRGTTPGAFAAPFVRGAVREALEDAARFEDATVPLRLIANDADYEDGVGDGGHEVLRVDDGGGLGRIEARETEAAVRRFVLSLPGNQQSMVKQVFWDDRSQAELARARGVSRKAITKTLQKVYARGRVELGEFRAA